MAIIQTDPACVNGNVFLGDLRRGKAFESAKPADPFDAEKTSLPVKTAAETAERAIGPEDTVARDKDGHGITPERASDGASRGGVQACFLSKS